MNDAAVDFPEAASGPTKVVGRRGRTQSGLASASGFLDLVARLVQRRSPIPKGVHRFHSFEEADAWTLRMITRRTGPVPRA